MGLRRMGDEELTAARVGPRERHTDRPRFVAHRVRLVAQREAGAAPSVPSRVAVLDDEVRNHAVPGGSIKVAPLEERDRKSTRLNSSHTVTSYAVFCLKKKNITQHRHHVAAGCENNRPLRGCAPYVAASCSPVGVKQDHRSPAICGYALPTQGCTVTYL